MWSSGLDSWWFGLCAELLYEGVGWNTTGDNGLTCCDTGITPLKMNRYVNINNQESTLH